MVSIVRRTIQFPVEHKFVDQGNGEEIKRLTETGREQDFTSVYFYNDFTSVYFYNEGTCFLGIGLLW